MKKQLRIQYLLIIFSLLSMSILRSAPVIISDPLKNGFDAGVPCVKWLVDINNDGLNDLLISQDLTPKEVQKNYSPHDSYGFGVYLALKNGKYINTQYLLTPQGKEPGGIVVDITQCYVGYIDEVKSHGIVTVQSSFSKRDHITTCQVICYTVNGYHMDESFLGKKMDEDNPNKFYKKYLSPSKLTKVNLQTFTP